MYINNQHQKAMELMHEKKFDPALSLLNELIGKNPLNPDLFHDRGLVYFHMENRVKSLEDMNKALELQPDYAYRYSSRAYIRDSMGDTRGAIEDYEIAVKMDPEDAVAHNNLGMLKEKLGYTGQAQAFFDIADKLGADQKIYKLPAEDKMPKNIQQEIDQEKKDKKVSGLIAEIFTSRKGFNEFLTFIRNGFKSK